MLTNINQFIFHDQETKDQVEMLINSQNIFPAARKGIIFYGQYGTGKTTLARLMTNAIDQARGCVYSGGTDLELECSAGDYRAQLKQVTATLNGNLWRHEPYHYVLFDEFDLYEDKQVQFKSITTHPNIGFFITTNNLSSITPSIVSRCHLVELKPPPAQYWQSYAAKMFAARNIAVTQQEIDAAINASRSLATRDMTDILEKLAYTKQKAA